MTWLSLSIGLGIGWAIGFITFPACVVIYEASQKRVLYFLKRLFNKAQRKKVLLSFKTSFIYKIYGNPDSLSDTSFHGSRIDTPLALIDITFSNGYMYSGYLKAGARPDGIWGFNGFILGGIGAKETELNLAMGTDLLVVVQQLEIIKNTFDEQHIKFTIHEVLKGKWDEVKKEIDNLEILKRKSDEV